MNLNKPVAAAGTLIGLLSVVYPELKDLANVHSLSAQRLYSLLCMAYEAEPGLFGEVVKKGGLQESRAEGCADEYKQVDYAYKQLIYPHIDQAVLKKAQPKTLFRPGQHK
jgi:hypothetical protein